MKRILICSLVIFSFFGLMVFARGGGSRGGSGGRGVSRGGTVARRSGGSGFHPVSHPSTVAARAHSIARPSGNRSHNYLGNYHDRGIRRRYWSGPAFWGPRYVSFDEYCDANPGDEQCYEDYYDGPSISIGF